MPALPNYHGQMAIGEPVAFLSARNVEQRSYHAGDTIGEFKLVSFDHENIEFEWHGKAVQRKLEELRPKETAESAPARPAAAASPAPNAAAVKPPAGASSPGPVVSLSGSSASSPHGPKDSLSDDPMFGPLQPDGTRGCAPGDQSPSGTVHAGYKKNMTVTLFGAVCSWEQNK
jgi:hypothetical protein